MIHYSRNEFDAIRKTAGYPRSGDATSCATVRQVTYTRNAKRRDDHSANGPRFECVHEALQRAVTKADGERISSHADRQGNQCPYPECAVAQ